MDALQLILIHDLPSPVLNNLPKSESNNGFLKILTSINSKKDLIEQHECDEESLIILLDEISKKLQLNEEEYEHLIDIIQSFFNQEEIKKLPKEKLQEIIALFITEFLKDRKSSKSQQITRENITLIQSSLRDIVQKISELSNETNKNSSLLLNAQEQNFRNVTLDPRLSVEQTQNEQQQQRFFQQFKHIVESIYSETDINQRAPEILKVLEQLFRLSKTETSVNLKQLSDSNEKVNTLLQELMDRYIKRMSFNNRTTYPSESKVTSRDIVKWMKHLAPKIVTQPLNSNVGEQIAPQIWKAHTLSPIEQYVVYMQRSEHQGAIDEALIKQFRQVIQTSQLYQQPLMTTNQLMITLKPDHLGEMLVRFVEVNGEMMVKILVTSQVAKTALETNLHQLKHMFSPHQVLIEKIDEQQVAPKEDTLSEDEQLEDQAQDQKKEEEKAYQESNSSNEFEQLLKEYV